MINCSTIIRKTIQIPYPKSAFNASGEGIFAELHEENLDGTTEKYEENLEELDEDTDLEIPEYLLKSRTIF